MRRRSHELARPAERRPRGSEAAAQDALILENLDLVQHVVNQLAARYPRHVERDELWNAGACGLVEAAGRYDPAGGVPFARYAGLRIRGAVIDSTRNRDWAARSVRRNAREILSAETCVEAREGHTARDAELAEELGITLAELARRRATVAQASLLHLDHRYDDEETLGASLHDDDPSVLPEEALERRELLGTLRSAVACLPPQQRQVVERYYLGGEMLQEIAATLGVTEARVSQICTEAVNAIRAYLGSMYEGVPVVAERAAGRRSRSAFVTAAGAGTTWRERLEASDGEWVAATLVASGA